MVNGRASSTWRANSGMGEILPGVPGKRNGGGPSLVPPPCGRGVNAGTARASAVPVFERRQRVLLRPPRFAVLLRAPPFFAALLRPPADLRPAEALRAPPLRAVDLRAVDLRAPPFFAAPLRA